MAEREAPSHRYRESPSRFPAAGESPVAIDFDLTGGPCYCAVALKSSAAWEKLFPNLVA